MKDIIKKAKEVLKIEAEAILNLIPKINESFCEAVNLMYECKGKIAVTGMGKSGIICKKIAATLASTGTPAFFLHPAEAIHGDLGMIVRGDLVLAISKSGETHEIIALIPAIKRLGVKLIALTGNLNSTLAKNADVVLDVSVKKEACPFGFAPTASTTAALAMGDALAMALLLKRGFKLEDVAIYHPGGALGKRLLRVGDLMHTGGEIPVVSINTLLKDAIYVMSSKRLGMVCVVDENEELVGIITDGDLRRLIEKDISLLEKEVRYSMTKNPKTISKDTLAAEAVQVMEKYSITSLIVINGAKRIEGVIHLHDLLKAKIV